MHQRATSAERDGVGMRGGHRGDQRAPAGSRAQLLEQLRDRVPVSVLTAMASVDRRWFVPEALRGQAWEVAATVERKVPTALLEQLADGGRLLVPVRDGSERLVLVRRERKRLIKTEHGAVRFVPLVSSH